MNKYLYICYNSFRMKKRVILLFATFTLLSTSMISNLNKDTLNKRDTNIIVELKDTQSKSVEEREIIQKNFLNELQTQIGLNYRVLNTYSNISNMINLQISSLDYEKVENIKYVNNIFENKTFDYEDTYESYFVPDTTNNTKPDKDYSRIEMNVPTSSKDGANTLICVIDDSFNVNHEMFKDLTSGYKYSKSTIENFKSQTDFNATNAGYLNNKIPFYYSYATNNQEMSYSNNKTFHGLHVAGIAGANNTFLGAAPNAQLALMRVTNSSGGFNETAILNALEDAMILKADVINMSFGSSIVDYTISNDFSNILTNLVDAGVQVNFAAGNDGKNKFETGAGEYNSLDTVEPSEMGYFAAYSKTNTIGALNLKNDDSMYSSFATKSGEVFFAKDQITVDALTSAKLIDSVDVNTFQGLISDDEEFIDLEYEIVGYGTDEEYENVNINGKIAIVNRGAPSQEELANNQNKYLFTTKIYNAARHGAIGVIICNTKSSSSSLGNTIINLNPGSGPTLTKSDYIPTALTSTYTYDLLSKQEEKIIRVGRRLDAEYSSDGSQTDLSLTPDVSAPGTNIYSGVSNTDGESLYTFMDGTSMATPNASGAMANIISNYDGDDLENYKKTLMARIQSTANPIEYVNGSYLSPRKVGAGAIDVEKTINSDIYFTYGDTNKAKVELKNNEDIKNGTIKFTIDTHNESNVSKKYKATLYVQAPATIIPDATLNVLNEKEVQTDKDVVLEKVSFDVTISTGDSKLDFEYKLSDENKKYLEKFTSGIQIEGYVVLESLSGNSGDIALSFPYMGFYGDYSSASAVEPFTFEKDSNVAYQSEIINQLADVYPANPIYRNADFRSIFAVGSQKLTTDEKYQIQSNKKNILNYYNEAEYSAKRDAIFLGLENESTYVYIQQFVSRNIRDNSVTLTNKDTGEVVYKKYLLNLNFTAQNNRSDIGEHPLVRSCLTSTLVSSGMFANLAYLEIPLVDSDNKLLYEEGNYELTFSYTLAYGYESSSQNYTQTRTYNVILGKVREVVNLEFIKKDLTTIENKKYYEVVFKAEDVKSVTFDGEDVEYELFNDENTYRFSLDLAELFAKDGSKYLEITDIYDNKIGLIIASYNGQIVVYDQENIDSSYRVWFNLDETSINNETNIKSYYFEYILISNNMEAAIDESNVMTFTVDFSNINDRNSIKVYELVNGVYQEMDYEIDDDKITINSKSKYIKVEYEIKHEDKKDDDKPVNNDNSGTILLATGLSIIGVGLIAVIIVLVVSYLKKKKEDK